MIKIKTDTRNIVEYTEDYFRAEIKGLLTFALNEKGYDIKDISPDMLAEDITGIFGEHNVPQEGMLIIQKVITEYV